MGHIINDSKLIAGSWIVPEDRSSMQTPLQASGMGRGGFANAPYVNNIAFDYMNIPITFDGFGELSTRDNKQFMSASGVFDSTGFRPPKESQFPRIY
ncbi:MAG: hypothetical protein NTX42_08175 [Methanothrix sp.]|nr:hypothetical protein [Methanothrix sp.]